ncbi:DUF2695 domain-containing protein [Microbacterium sp. P04]|uniref:DUF2695 domain-containing protein n=1 Tax=Microbacterium sp. P04 TaxID=3366947 RepID=UPI003744D969
MTTIDTRAEEYLRQLSARRIRPEEGECLVCFVNRMLNAFGCDNTLRFARAWRDERAPRATSLEERLADRGGFCDCEILYNAYWPAGHLWSVEQWNDLADGGQEYTEGAPPETMPSCELSRKGSTKPCGLWEGVRRGANW